MIQRLDELRRLLEGLTVSCPLCFGTGVYPTRLEILQGKAENSYTCDRCGGSGRVPDPKWAPMLALLTPQTVAIQSAGIGLPAHRETVVFTPVELWSLLPEGALAGAIREAAWHAGIARPVLDAAFAEIFGADSPNQAAVDWCIARLKERNG